MCPLLAKRATWRNKQDHVTLSQPEVPPCNFSPSVAENGGEIDTVSQLWWQTWRPRLQDQHKTFKSQREHYKKMTSSVYDWRGSGKADITVASLGTASGFWQALLQEGSSLSTTFTTPFWEALPFSHLLFVINITQKISRHERKHLLEKGWRAEPSAERMLFCMEIK